jgi:hypothetical protein
MDGKALDATAVRGSAQPPFNVASLCGTRPPMMNPHEIWFARVLWSYMPIHWKGWALLLGLAFGIIVLIQIISRVISAIGHPEWEGVEFIPIPVGVIWSWIVAERHAPPPRS